MLSAVHLQELQRILGYFFRRVQYLSLAMTAARADEQTPDGNRRLAMLGGSVLQTASILRSFIEEADRSQFDVP